MHRVMRDQKMTGGKGQAESTLFLPIPLDKLLSMYTHVCAGVRSVSITSILSVAQIA